MRLTAKRKSLLRPIEMTGRSPMRSGLLGRYSARCVTGDENCCRFVAVVPSSTAFLVECSPTTVRYSHICGVACRIQGTTSMCRSQSTSVASPSRVKNQIANTSIGLIHSTIARWCFLKNMNNHTVQNASAAQAAIATPLPASKR